MRRFSPDPNGPQVAVTWYEAAMFCNWLSEREGIPQSEWVYPSTMDDIRGCECPMTASHRLLEVQPRGALPRAFENVACS